MQTKKYKLIPNYSMKCRLYLNKTQQKEIDNLLYGKAAAYNMILHNLKQYMFCDEIKSKENPDEIVHFPNFDDAVKKVELDKLRFENEYVNYVPGGALSGKNGAIADIKKAWEKTGKHPIEQWDWFKELPDGTIQHFGPQFHSKYDNHVSLAYQTSINNIVPTENRNVIKIKISPKNYPIDGLVKIRGWNQSLRFDNNLQMDFVDWVNANKKTKLTPTIRILRDLDRYYIIFLLKNVYRPYSVSEERNSHIGIDVGEITLAALSDETKYDNIFNANRKFEKTINKIDNLNAIKSRRWGYSNEEFREKRKENRGLKPSKRYSKTQKRIHRLHSRRHDIMNDYYNKVTSDIIKNNAKVNVETLNVKDMFWYKEKENEKAKTRKNKKTNSNPQSESI